MPEPQKIISIDYFRMMTGRMLPLISLLLITVMYSHSLSKESYGIFQSTWMYTNLASVAMGFGITTIIFSTNTGIFRSLFRNNRKSIIIFYAVLWICCLVLFYLFAVFPPITKFLISIFILFQNINSITESWLIKNNNSGKYLRVNIIYSSLFFLWHFYILHQGYDLEKLIIGVIAISFLKLLALLAPIRNFKTTENIDTNERKIFSHWAFIGFNDILSVFSKWIDKLILIYLLSPSEFAIFFNGSIEIPFFTIFISMSGNYQMMQISKDQQNVELMKSVFRENFKFLTSFVFPGFFLLMFFRHDIFLLFFSEKYLESIPVFAITILILPFRINDYGTILQVFSKGNIITRGSVLELGIAILLITILYPIYGMRGAAAALVLSTIIQISYYFFHTTRVIHSSISELIPLKSLIIRFIISGLLFFMLHMVVEGANPLMSVVSGIGLFLVSAFFLGKSFIYSLISSKK